MRMELSNNERELVSHTVLLENGRRGKGRHVGWMAGSSDLACTIIYLRWSNTGNAQKEAIESKLKVFELWSNSRNGFLCPGPARRVADADDYGRRD